MRRNIELYIDGQRADITVDSLVLMNYKQTDATAPAAVYNNWSQQVVLPRTSHNNAIFGHICEVDHRTVSGQFNALVRTPFVIYSEEGGILESGYLKLNDISQYQYSVTLYGGLGGFLFSLMYNADGSKKSLADLVYTYGGDEHEFDFQITRDAVRAAWRHLAGLETQFTPWSHINFAPAYNGLPGGDFDSKKAFCPTANVRGVSASQTEGGVTYNSRRGHTMVTFPDALDEWATMDLRSYLQRPVIRFGSIINAITTYAQGLGYQLEFDNGFFTDSNPYADKLWMTLPKLDGITLPNESASGSVHVDPPSPGAAPTYGDTSRVDKVITGPWLNKGFMAKTSASVTFTPSIKMDDIGLTRLAAWELPDSPSGRRYWRVVTLYQLIALDANGTVVGGSKVAAASTYTKCQDSATPLERTVSPATFVQKYNNALSTHPNSFTPAWVPESGDVYESAMCNGEKYFNMQGYNIKQLVDSSNNPLTITLSFSDVAGVAEVRLRTTYLAIYSTGGYGVPYWQADVDALPRYDGVNNQHAFQEVNFWGCDLDYSYNISGTAHSGATITKRLLLGGTKTPAEYLLSFMKMFGLYMAYDPTTRKVSVMRRNAFYDGDTIDLQQRIDHTTMKTVPFAISSRWYEWFRPSEGRFVDYYKDAYGRDYGMARVNTGFEFNSDHNDVLKDCVFKTAAEVLRNSKYFTRLWHYENGVRIEVPTPFMDGGKYALWNSSGESKEFDIMTAQINNSESINQLYPGYDYQSIPKAEFCDKDNKALDGSDVLLLFDGCNGTAYYSRYTLTDDNGLMTIYNEGTPCWLIGQDTIASNEKYTINSNPDRPENRLHFPRFHRFLAADSVTPRTATCSLEMGTPTEIDQPEFSISDSVNIFTKGWAAYINDKMDVDTKVVTCKVNLRGFQVGQQLLRKFYWFDGCLWVMNAIKNYILGGDEMTECEFIKVKDKTNYTNGQTY